MTNGVTKITKKSLLAELQAIAEERPNRVQEACRYERYRKPHCVIGTVLHNFGVSPATLRQLDGCQANSIDEVPVLTILSNAGVVLTPAAQRVAAKAQRVADSGVATWAEAYKAAKRAAK